MKYLLTYDLGLKETDAAWYPPLLAYAQIRALKNIQFAPRIPNTGEKLSGRISTLGTKKDVKIERLKAVNDTCTTSAEGFIPQWGFRCPTQIQIYEPNSRPRSCRGSSASNATTATAGKSTTCAIEKTTKHTTSTTAGESSSCTATAVNYRSPSAQRPVASRSLGTSGTTPPWREHEERRNRVGRERSETPQGRNTRTLTETRSSAGGHWTNTGRSQRERPINVPELRRCRPGCRARNGLILIIPICQNRHHRQRRTALAVQVIFNRHTGEPIRKLT